MRHKKSAFDLHRDVHMTNIPFSILTPQPEKIVEPGTTAGGTNMYFEVLELQPIKLTISFMRTERVSGEEK